MWFTRKGQKTPNMGRPSVSSSSFRGRTNSSEFRGRGIFTVRDIPPRRNLASEFASSSSSHTGGFEARIGEATILGVRPRVRAKESCGDPGLPPGNPVMHTIHDPR
jgi:hypothetical protein